MEMQSTANSQVDPQPANRRQCQQTCKFFYT